MAPMRLVVLRGCVIGLGSCLLAVLAYGRQQAAGAAGAEAWPLPMLDGAAGPHLEAPFQGSGWAVHLPITIRGQWTGAASGAATAAARAATVRAATRVAATATAAARTGTAQTATPRTSGTPSASPTELGPTLTPSLTPTGPTLTPRPTGTPFPTATDSWPATPGPSPTLPDPAADRIRPAGALFYGTTHVEADPDGRTLRLWADGAQPVVFEIDLKHPDNLNGRLAIRETASNRFPVAGGGLYYQTADGRLFEPRLLGYVGRVQSVEHSVAAAGVAITVTERLDGAEHRKRYDIGLAGRSLTVRLRSLDGPKGPADGAYVAAATGDIEGTSHGVNVRLPFMEAVPVTMLDQRWFVSSLLDFTVSSADALIPRGPEQTPGAFVNELLAFYTPDASGRLLAVDETFHVTVSSRVNDAFPVPQNPRSPNDRRLANRVLVTLDASDGAPSFTAQAAYIERLAALRMTDLLVVPHGWSDPATLPPQQGPPNPAAGGPEAWARLANAAPALVPPLDYTQTVPPCPGGPAPLYSANDRLAHSDGQSKSFPERTTPCGGDPAAPHYLLAPDAARRIALAGAGAPPEEADAAFVQELATWHPGFPAPGADGNLLDRGGRHPAQVNQGVIELKRLLAQLQRSAGPLVADGAYGPWELGFGAFLPGYLDGATGEVANGSPDGVGGARHIVVPDYGLVLTARSVTRFGMGAFGRFFGPEDPSALYPLNEARMDEWRATVLSYGSAPAWQAQPSARQLLLAPADEAREYFLGKPISSYLAGHAALVAYVPDSGPDQDLSAALKADADLARPRLRIGYDNGATVWVNHSEVEWLVVLNGFSYRLPVHGWLVAHDAAGILGYSALRDGRRVDYLRSPEWEVMDGRGQTTSFPGRIARDLVVVFPDGAVLEESPDGSLALRGP